jgi:hypothetical protein
MLETMSINDAGTFLRTSQQEKADVDLAIENIRAELWKEWPNEAGVCIANLCRHQLV